VKGRAIHLSGTLLTGERRRGGGERGECTAIDRAIMVEGAIRRKREKLSQPAFLTVARILFLPSFSFFSLSSPHRWSIVGKMCNALTTIVGEMQLHD